MKNILAVVVSSTNGQPRIGETGHLERAYRFGRSIYPASRSGERSFP